MSVPFLQHEVSIDDFVDADEETRMEAFLADPKAENQVQRVHDIEVVRLVKRALLGLDARERHIIRNRFGFLGVEEQTLEQIGSVLRLSRERVRQLERQAKDKLRAMLGCLQAYVG